MTSPNTTRCADHPNETEANCGSCRSELLGGTNLADEKSGFDKLDRAVRHARLTDRLRRLATARWNAQCDPEFADASMADVPTLVTEDAAVIYAWVDAQAGRADPLPWLLIEGPVGTGKTHLQHAIMREVVTGPNPVEVTMVTAPEMFDSLRPGAAFPGERLAVYQTVPMLVIDDLGANAASAWVEERMHLILNDRYRRRLPVVFTTNLEPEDLRAAIGARMISRLRQRCLRVLLAGADRRRPPTLDGLALGAPALEASDK